MKNGNIERYEAVTLKFIGWGIPVGEGGGLVRKFDSLWDRYNDDYSGLWIYEGEIDIDGRKISRNSVFKKVGTAD